MGKSGYIIKFGGLPVGNHEFEFEVTGKFFNDFENTEIQNADIKVCANLLKQNNLLQMEFNIEGTVGIDCDRCLKYFNFPVEANEKLVIKHGNVDESNDEILVIPEGETEFDVSQYLFEYIVTAIPARKVPCEIDGKKFKCDRHMLEKLSENSSADEENAENNPLWEQLNKIKFNKN